MQLKKKEKSNVSSLYGDVSYEKILCSKRCWCLFPLFVTLLTPLCPFETLNWISYAKIEIKMRMFSAMEANIDRNNKNENKTFDRLRSCQTHNRLTIHHITFFMSTMLCLCLALSQCQYMHSDGFSLTHGWYACYDCLTSRRQGNIQRKKQKKWFKSFQLYIRCSSNDIRCIRHETNALYFVSMNVSFSFHDSYS